MLRTTSCGWLNYFFVTSTSRAGGLSCPGWCRSTFPSRCSFEQASIGDFASLAKRVVVRGVILFPLKANVLNTAELARLPPCGLQPPASAPCCCSLWSPRAHHQHRPPRRMRPSFPTQFRDAGRPPAPAPRSFWCPSGGRHHQCTDNPSESHRALPLRTAILTSRLKLSGYTVVGSGNNDARISM